MILFLIYVPEYRQALRRLRGEGGGSQCGAGLHRAGTPQEIGTGEMSLELDQLYRKAQEILEQREETVIAGKTSHLKGYMK